MNEIEMTNIISEKRKVPFEMAKRDLDVLLECITEELEKGGSVKLVDFGTFEVAKRAAKKGFNPYYRKSVDIPPCNEPVFKPGKALKELIKNL